MNEIPVRSYGAAAVVVRRQADGVGSYLLVKRTRPPVGAWTYVAGRIEPHETAYQAAVREVREETGLAVRSLFNSDQCEQFYEPGKDSIWIAPVFVAFTDERSTVVLNEEHDEYRWCTVEQATGLLTFPGAVEIVRQIHRNFVVSSPEELLRIEI